MGKIKFFGYDGIKFMIMFIIFSKYFDILNIKICIKINFKELNVL